MKKLHAFVLSAVVCLSFAACGNTRGAIEDNSAHTPPVSSQPAVSPQPRQTATPAVTDPPAATPQPDNSHIPAVSEELMQLMEELVYTTAPGTAGSSLKAVYAARDLSRRMTAAPTDSETIVLSVAQFMAEYPDKEEVLWAFDSIGNVFAGLSEKIGAESVLEGTDVTVEDFSVTGEGMASVSVLLHEIEKYR